MDEAGREGPAGAEGPVLARIAPSAPRRLFGVAVLAALGLLLILLAFLRPPELFLLRLFLLCLGALSLALAVRVNRATAGEIRLLPDRLCDGEGRVIARLDQVAAVERGVFAFKPSNGFLLRLDAKQPRAWAPGLWWRLGRRVGIGGTISGAEGRQMADAIAALIARRRAGEGGGG
ncbi:hypothetical protein [Albidovulum sp.]